MIIRKFFVVGEIFVVISQAPTNRFPEGDVPVPEEPPGAGAVHVAALGVLPVLPHDRYISNN